MLITNPYNDNLALPPRVLGWMDCRCCFTIEISYYNQRKKRVTFRPVIFLNINNKEILTHVKASLANLGIACSIETSCSKARIKIKGGCQDFIRILLKNKKSLSFFTWRFKQLVILEKILPKMQMVKSKHVFEILDCKFKLNQPRNWLENKASPFFQAVHKMRSSLPGDVREKQVGNQGFSREEWQDRLGFKKAALENKANTLFLDAEKQYNDHILATQSKLSRFKFKSSKDFRDSINFYLISVFETKGEILWSSQSPASPEIRFSLKRGEELVGDILSRFLQDKQPEICLKQGAIHYKITRLSLIKSFYLFLKLAQDENIKIYKENREEFMEWCKSQGW